MILLVGDPEDLSTTYVRWLANRRGESTQLLPEDDLGMSWHIRLSEEPSLEVDKQRIPLGDVRGAFVRLNPHPGLPEPLADLGESDRRFVIAERRQGLQWLLDRAGFMVVNRPSAGRENGSKPLQMAMLKDAGFAVPDWIATNDIRRAKRFLSRHPDGVVIKACSGLRSRVRLVGVDVLDVLANGAAPAVLQRYMPGYDVRIHVVGQALFASRMDSHAVDYRFDDAPTTYSRTTPPERVARLSREVAASSGLALAGLDFRVDHAGQWWCLEMNPVPTFLPYEAGAGHAIGDAIVDLLIGHPPRTERDSVLGSLIPAPAR